MSKLGVSHRKSAETAAAVTEVKRRRKRVEIVKITVDGPDGTSVEVDAKGCRGCGTVKALVDYNRSSFCFGGVKPRCKVCQSYEYKQKRKNVIRSEIEGVPIEPKKRANVEVKESIDERGNTVHLLECYRCKETKPTCDFFRNKNTKIGFDYHCKECVRSLRGRKSRYIKTTDTNGITTKECKMCKKTKSLEDFYKGSCAGGKKSYCKSCNRDIAISKYDSDARAERYIKNREPELERMRKWVKDNKERVKAHVLNRRALKEHLPQFLTGEDVENTLKLFSMECPLTGSKDDIHMDHFIALKSGHGGSYRANMIPLLGKFNISKSKKNPFKWVRRRKDIDANRFAAVVAYIADLNGLSIDEYRQFVDWCYANHREVDDIKRDNSRYGYVVSSLELWREATGYPFPLRIDFRQESVKEAVTA